MVEKKVRRSRKRARWQTASQRRQRQARRRKTLFRPTAAASRRRRLASQVALSPNRPHQRASIAPSPSIRTKYPNPDSGRATTRTPRHAVAWVQIPRGDRLFPLPPLLARRCASQTICLATGHPRDETPRHRRGPDAMVAAQTRQRGRALSRTPRRPASCVPVHKNNCWPSSEILAEPACAPGAPRNHSFGVAHGVTARHRTPPPGFETVPDFQTSRSPGSWSPSPYISLR